MTYNQQIDGVLVDLDLLTSTELTNVERFLEVRSESIGRSIAGVALYRELQAEKAAGALELPYPAVQ